MEVGAHVWLRSQSSRWGWVPALITKKEDGHLHGTSTSASNGGGGSGGVPVIHLTLTNDVMFEDTDGIAYHSPNHNNGNNQRNGGGGDRSDRSGNMWGRQTSNESLKEFETTITVDTEQLKTADHQDIKLRNLPRSYQIQLAKKNLSSPVSNSHGNSHDNDNSNSNSDEEMIVGGVNDLIGLTHLHEPAILHALRLRYNSDIIYTSTGPILIAVNPFKNMPLYTEEVMDLYRKQGEGKMNGNGNNGGDTSSGIIKESNTPFKRRTNDALIQKMNRGKGKSGNERLPPHAYQTADDAYRAMMRGMENDVLMSGSNRRMNGNGRSGSGNDDIMPTNQSILVSGESGAGKTVTTKIVLNYMAMLSKVAASTSTSSSTNDHNHNNNMSMRSSSGFASPETVASTSAHSIKSQGDSSTVVIPEDVCIEQQVLQSNPILESFGNARTMRNDNSSRFGKYIDIQFSQSGKLTGASIETYLLEKVRLIHPGMGERNYHVFYQFLKGANREEREQFFIDDFGLEDFKLLSVTGEYGRRDGVLDMDNHVEMKKAMVSVLNRRERLRVKRVKRGASATKEGASE